MRRTKHAVVLTEEQQAQLRTLVGRGVAPARRLTHARILLRTAHGAGGALLGSIVIPSSGGMVEAAGTPGRHESGRTLCRPSG